ncbi:hypothetical protein ACFFGH_29220 [Lysobacter korlensis]|uniref:Transmembrane protein n=1 Tax=Lysobacter korlensis TaxID=553636 RepID=A0ABV6RY74_9GAMM
MGFFSNLLGIRRPADPVEERAVDELAVQRYEHLLRTAPPETVEQVHTEAFERLTQQQRDLLFQKLLDGARTPEERPADASSASLAKSATDAEVVEPGALSRLIGGRRGKDGDDLLGGSLLNSIAAYAVASSVFEAFFFAAAVGHLPPVDPSGNGRTDEPVDPSTFSPDAGWGDFGL